MANLNTLFGEAIREIAQTDKIREQAFQLVQTLIDMGIDPKTIVYVIKAYDFNISAKLEAKVEASNHIINFEISRLNESLEPEDETEYPPAYLNQKAALAALKKLQGNWQYAVIRDEYQESYYLVDLDNNVKIYFGYHQYEP